MLWVGTYSGSANGSGCGACASELDVAVAFMVFSGSTSAAGWNATRPAWTSHDALAGSKVCSWVTDGSASGTQISFCGGGVGDIREHAITTYLGDDNKWRMVFAANVVAPGLYFGTIAGEAEFNGSGAPMNCGTPGEGSPTFSLSIPLTRYDTFGTPNSTCFPPTSVLVEGNPQ